MMVFIKILDDGWWTYLSKADLLLLLLLLLFLLLPPPPRVGCDR